MHSGDTFSLGVHTITAGAIDHAGNAASETFTIQVQDSAPLAHDDSYGTTLDHALVVNAAGVLGNDTDVENDPLSAVLQTDASHGHVSLGADGSFTYTPYLAFAGNDSFVYKANDGAVDSNLATVNIGVTDGPDTFDFSTNPNQNWTVNLSAANETAFTSKTGTQTFTGDNNVIAGPGTNTIIGNNHGDVLIGGSGNDTIKGGTGNDVFAPGNGTNTIVSGGGNDVFVFKPGSFTDTISGFDPVHDMLDFQGFAGLTPANLASTILADVTSSHTAANTIIALDATEHMTLLGVTYNQLAASHPFELNI